MMEEVHGTQEYVDMVVVSELQVANTPSAFDDGNAPSVAARTPGDYDAEV